jgi:hypothetical protein
MDHQKALKEKSDGFNTIELEIFTKLSNAAASLGAKLISIEVRELSFPNLEAQEVQLAAKEAETRAKKMEAQRELELRKLEAPSISSFYYRIIFLIRILGREDRRPRGRQAGARQAGRAG